MMAEFKDKVTWIKFLVPLTQKVSDLFFLRLLCVLEAPALYKFTSLSFFPARFNPPSPSRCWNMLSRLFICSFCQAFCIFTQSVSVCVCSFILSSSPSLNQQTQHFSVFCGPLPYISPQTQIWEHIRELIKDFYFFLPKLVLCTGGGGQFFENMP